jgi:dihydropteroate synthase
MFLRARHHIICFPRRPLVMGIVNLSDDSFSGDGSPDIEQALSHAHNLISAGADIIDVGGESARTNRPAISAAEEIERVRPFVQRFEEAGKEVTPIDTEQLFPPLLSINTWRSEVARSLLTIGGDLLNDMSALPVDDNARIAAEAGVALVIMHSVGLPKQKHTHIRYADIWEELTGFFETRINVAVKAGVDRDRIVLDPGIDFAKQRLDNLKIYRHLERLQKFARPTLLPVSRKTVIGETLGIDDPHERDAGTIACIVSSTLRGASIFRVHNVHAAVQALRVIWPVVGRS